MMHLNTPISKMLPDLLMPAPGVKLARHFLEAIGAPPWGILAAGRLHSLTAKTLPSLQKLMLGAQKQRQGIITVLPIEGGKVRHVVIHVPPGARLGELPMPPSIVIIARETTLIWSLADFTKADVANTLATRLAKLTGGRAEHGACVPLPGSILYEANGASLTRMWQVRMLPPSSPRYSLINGHLVSPASAASPAYDSRTLSVPLGTAANKSAVVWQPGKLTNGFALVLGSSGSGKTWTLRVLGAGIKRYGVPVLIFDFHGDVKIPGVRDVLLSSGTDSTLGINPLELDGTCGRQSGLYDQRGALREMIMRACPTLGHRQSNALREAIEQVYAKAGIVDADPSTWTRSPPTFADLMEEITDVGLRAGASELFGHPIFNRTEHIGISDLLQRSTRLDLSKLSDGVRFIATETLLQRIFRLLRMQGPISITPSSDRDRFRLFIFIDEAKILAMGGGANILDTLATEARKFGVGMILASQMTEHFSETTRANSATWLVLRPQAMAEAKRNAADVGVTAEQLLALKGDGDGYFRDRNGGEARRIQVRAL